MGTRARARVAGQAAGDHGAGEEQSPVASRLRPRLGRGGEHRFERERRNQRQTEHEPAMEVRPQRHHAEQRRGRRARGGAGREQAGDERLHRWQGQKVRPRQQHRRQRGHGEQAQHQDRQRRQHASEMTGEIAHRQRRCRRGQQHHAAPAADVPGQREAQLAQPLMRHPRRARQGEGERIGARHGAMGEHPLSGGNVPIGIRIAEQLARRGERCGKRQQGEDRREGGRAHRRSLPPMRLRAG